MECKNIEFDQGLAQRDENKGRAKNLTNSWPTESVLETALGDIRRNLPEHDLWARMIFGPLHQEQLRKSGFTSRPSGANLCVTSDLANRHRFTYQENGETRFSSESYSQSPAAMADLPFTAYAQSGYNGCALNRQLLKDPAIHASGAIGFIITFRGASVAEANRYAADLGAFHKGKSRLLRPQLQK